MMFMTYNIYNSASPQNVFPCTYPMIKGLKYEWSIVVLLYYNQTTRPADVFVICTH